MKIYNKFYRQYFLTKNYCSNALYKTLLLAVISVLAACGGGKNNATTTSSQSSSEAPIDMSGGEAYEEADGIVGGQLYSKFWASETGFTLGNSNLDNQGQLDAVTGKSDFFRCKQCHGWDRLGRDGGYSNRAPSTSRPNVADINLALVSEVATPRAIFDSIKGSANSRSVDADLSNYDPNNNAATGDQMPAYGEILTDEQIWDIVKYLKEEALDTTAIYDLVLENGQYPNRPRSFQNLGVNGSPTAGDAIYTNNCAMCHGADGTKILVDGESYTVGRHMRYKPYEDQHKVKFGHLGSTMGPILKDSDIDDIQDLFAAMNDVTKYPDEQPAPEPVVDGKTLFTLHCSDCHSGNGVGASTFGDVSNQSAARITSEIGSVRLMQSLSSLTSEEINLIADFLSN